MGIPVRELQERISSAEFVEYMASYQLDQRGGHYDDLRAGAIAAMIANVNRDTSKRETPYGILDFIPWNETRQVDEDVVAAGPVLLDDPDQQTALLLTTLFPGKDLPDGLVSHD